MKELRTPGSGSESFGHSWRWPAGIGSARPSRRLPDRGRRLRRFHAAPGPDRELAARLADRGGTRPLNVAEPERFTVEFTADGRASLRADCNRCSAATRPRATA